MSVKPLPPFGKQFLAAPPAAGLWVAIGPQAWNFARAKPFPVLAGAAALFATSAAVSQPMSPSEVFAAASRSVVVVHGLDVNGEITGQGSGVREAPAREAAAPTASRS